VNFSFSRPHDKRAHHNALERKRRDHIKESFSGLRDAVPTITTVDKSSRAQILKKASEYITLMRKRGFSHQKDIDDLKRQNEHLVAQIRALEKAKTNGAFGSAAEVLESSGLNYDVPGISVDSQDSSPAGGDESLGYEGSGSGSDTSESSAPSGRGSAVGVRTVQPGQSLLITSAASPAIYLASKADAEPARKKAKI
jgi:Max protein